MTLSELSDLVNELYDEGMPDDAEIQFVANPHESELIHVAHSSTDAINGSVTFSREIH